MAVSNKRKVKSPFGGAKTYQEYLAWVKRTGTKGPMATLSKEQWKQQREHPGFRVPGVPTPVMPQPTPGGERIQPGGTLGTPGTPKYGPLAPSGTLGTPGTPKYGPLTTTGGTLGTPEGGRKWGEKIPGEFYPAIEGPGNPSWEARNPQIPGKGRRTQQGTTELTPAFGGATTYQEYLDWVRETGMKGPAATMTEEQWAEEHATGYGPTSGGEPEPGEPEPEPEPGEPEPEPEPGWRPDPKMEGELVRIEGQPEVYLIENGKKRHIISPKVLEAAGYNAGTVKVLPAADVENYPTGSKFIGKNGTLVRLGDQPEVYFVYGDSKYHVTSLELPEFKGKSVVVLEEEAADAFNQSNTGKEYYSGMEEELDLLEAEADKLRLPPQWLADAYYKVLEKIIAGEQLTEEDQSILAQASEYMAPTYEETPYAAEAEEEARLEALRYEEYYDSLLEESQGDYDRAKKRLDEDLNKAIQEGDEDKERFLRDLDALIAKDTTRLETDYATLQEQGRIDNATFFADLEETALTKLGRLRTDFETAMEAGEEDKADFLAELGEKTTKALTRLGEDKDTAIEREDSDKAKFLTDLMDSIGKIGGRLVEDYYQAKEERDQDRVDFLTELAGDQDRILLRLTQDYDTALAEKQTDQVRYLGQIAEDERLLSGRINEDYAVATGRLDENDRIFKAEEQYTYDKAVQSAREKHNLQGTYWSGLKDRELKDLGTERGFLLEKQAVEQRRALEDAAMAKGRGLEDVSKQYGRAGEEYQIKSEREIQELMKETGRTREDIMREEEETRTKYEKGYGREAGTAETSYARALTDIAESKTKQERDYTENYQRRMDDLLKAAGRTESDIFTEKRLAEQGFLTPWERQYGTRGALETGYGRSTEDIATAKTQTERDYLEAERRTQLAQGTGYTRGMEDIAAREQTQREPYLTAYQREQAAQQQQYGRTSEDILRAQEVKQRELEEKKWEATKLAAEKARQGGYQKYLAELARQQEASKY